MGRRDTLGLDEMLVELIEPRAESTPVEVVRGGTRYGRQHRVVAPALLDQLRGLEPLRGEGRRGASGSTVPVSIEALDIAARIDLQAARWVRELGEDDPGDTVDLLAVLRKLAASLDRCRLTSAGCCSWHELESDVRDWWLSARAVSGWSGRPWSPAVPCPVCEHRGALRIRLAEQLAVCVECRATWDSETIPLLAAMIRGDGS